MKIRELGILSNLSLSNDQCNMCMESKSTKKTYKLILSRETKFLSLVHNGIANLKKNHELRR